MPVGPRSAAVAFSVSTICWGVSAVFAWWSRAATPATWGAAIEVPE